MREGLLAAPLGNDGIGEPAQEADDAGRVADPTGVLMQQDIEDVVQGLDPPVGPICQWDRSRRAYSRGVSARRLMW